MFSKKCPNDQSDCWGERSGEVSVQGVVEKQRKTKVGRILALWWGEVGSFGIHPSEHRHKVDNLKTPK